MWRNDSSILTEWTKKIRYCFVSVFLCALSISSLGPSGFLPFVVAFAFSFAKIADKTQGNLVANFYGRFRSGKKSDSNSSIFHSHIGRHWIFTINK